MMKSLLLWSTAILAIFFFSHCGDSDDGGGSGLDSGWGGTGIVTTNFGAGDDYLEAISMHGDKVFATGAAYTTKYDFGIAKYNPDGSLDSSFDSDGKALVSFSSTRDDYAYAVAVQNDGKAIVAGYTTSASDKDFGAVRLNTDGSLDTGFASSGRFTSDVTTNDDIVRAVTVQSDGKIILAGQAESGSNYNFGIMRLSASGVLDTSFDGDGIALASFGSSDDIAYGIVIQSDGKIIAAGSTTHNISGLNFAMIRLTTGGVADATFGSSGKVTTSISNGDEEARGVALDNNGRIYLVGTKNNGTNNDIIVARYGSAGSLDASYGTSGVAQFDIGASADSGYGVRIDGSAKAVAAGTMTKASSNNFAIVRITNSGAPDLAFTRTGSTTVDVGASEEVRALAIQPDGKILVGGFTRPGSTFDFAIIRYNS